MVGVWVVDTKMTVQQGFLNQRKENAEPNDAKRAHISAVNMMDTHELIFVLKRESKGVLFPSPLFYLFELSRHN